MKIVHVEDRFHPGMGYQINYMARFHRAENEFIILTSTSTSIWGNIPQEELDVLDREFEQKYQVKIVRLDAYMAADQKSNVWIKGLIAKLKELKPDVIYAHGIEYYSTIRIFSVFSNTKVVLATDTHTLYNQFKGGIKESIYFKLINSLVISKINKHKIKSFYTATENKTIMLDDYGVEPSNIFPCPIGTDLDVFRYDEQERTNVRGDLKITEKERVLLYTGKLNYRKEPHLILKAIEMVENKIDFPLTLVFVGSVEEKYYQENFKHNIKNANIKIIELPPQPNDQLYKYYSMADFAVFPKENTLSALDAQACKLPVIMQSDVTNNER
ncbi:glycosyltransferase family 4 protein, partial [bacterium]|nr:glycosyltransferase family 4 protein [bacterium]